MDIERHVIFWRDSAQEDWEVAVHLIRAGRTRHGMFFAHLALEKLLKALVCQHTQDIAPRIHNLVRLAELANLSPTEEQLDLLAEMNVFNIEGRYPELLGPPLLQEEAEHYLQRAEEVFQWLTNQLSV